MKVKPTIIGICGGSCSGKTYFTEKIEHHFLPSKVSTVSQDNYYKDLSGLSIEIREKNNFDHPNSIESLLLFKDLQKLKNGESIESPIYDFENHARSKFKNIINPKELIVVEGIFVFYFKNIRKLLDISIFIDTPSKIRYERRLERDTKNRGRTKNSIEKQFFSMVKPMHSKFIEPYKKFSNFVISHNQKSELSFNSLFKEIENLKKGK